MSLAAGFSEVREPQEVPCNANPVNNSQVSYTSYWSTKGNAYTEANKYTSLPCCVGNHAHKTASILVVFSACSHYNFGIALHQVNTMALHKQGGLKGRLENGLLVWPQFKTMLEGRGMRSGGNA